MKNRSIKQSIAQITFNTLCKDHKKVFALKGYIWDNNEPRIVLAKCSGKKADLKLVPIASKVISMTNDQLKNR